MRWSREKVAADDEEEDDIDGSRLIKDLFCVFFLYTAQIKEGSIPTLLDLID